MQLPTKKFLTLEAAGIAMAASEAAAAAAGWKVVIAVVDDGGHALMVHRIDGTQSSSVETALGKARAAVAWKRSTRLLEEMVNNGRVAFLSTSQGMTLLQGGLPVEIDGQVVGGVGVSGVKASDDEAIAQAGVDALKAALR
jgi:glc operon protein GlcG